jgi:hypothetical protein
VALFHMATRQLKLCGSYHSSSFHIPIQDLLFRYLSYTHSISNNNVRRFSQHLCLPDAALSLGLALPGLAVDVLCGGGLESGLVLGQV